MATRIVLPLLGQTMEEGTVTRWLKSEGDYVEKGEPLLEVMTDKANMEVESPDSGVLRKKLAQDGEVVPVQGLLGIIGSADEPIEDLLQPVETAHEAGSRSTTLAVEPRRTAAARTDAVFASPRAKKAAAEHGIDIGLLKGKGTGPQGRIIEKDVLAFAADAHPSVKVTKLAGKMAADIGVDIASVIGTGAGGKVTRDDVVRASAKTARLRESRTIPLTGIRKLVADNVTASVRTAPHVTLVTEVDMTSCLQMRQQLLPEYEKKYSVRLTVTGMIVKAAALALLDHMIVNSSLLDDSIIIHGEVNIGVAAAVEDGLLVPVIRDADRKQLHEIASELQELTAKARAGSLSLDEMKGGTFTVTNLAAYGIDMFNPVINQPESAILGVCRTVEKPVVVDGQVQVRDMMNLCLSFDHRVMDGAPAGAYLTRVREILEAPYLLLV